MFFVILIVFAALGFFVQNRLKSKFKKYSEIGISTGMSGREMALQMLHDNGIFDVEVKSVPGQLTDHYNPTDKTINLSPEVYSGRSIAAAAVAAHECGHAVQHAKAYAPLTMRSKMVPIVNVASRMFNMIMIASLILGSILHNLPMMGLFVVGTYAIITAFSLITLPVEYDASNRALAWLENNNITQAEEHVMAKDALKWAARTYLVQALATVVTLLYFIMRMYGRD